MKEWQPKKVTNRGITEDTAIQDVLQIDLMLAYLAQYAPKALYRDITLRATSLSAVWTLVRQWAGLKSSGCKQHVYYQMKHTYEPNGDLTPNDFFFSLRNAKEDCLLLSAASGGKVSFQGDLPPNDEDLSPTLESDIVVDWLDSMGGQKLVDHVFRAFSKELETESLADLRQRLTECLPYLLSESELNADMKRASISYPAQPWKQSFRPPGFRPAAALSRQQYRPRFPSQPRGRGYPSQAGSSDSRSTPCPICLRSKPRLAYSHTVAFCLQLTESDKRQITRVVLTEDDETEGAESPFDHPEDDEEIETHAYTESLEEESVANTRLVKSEDDLVVRIKRVNVMESPILVVTYCGVTVYLILDTGATSSLMSQ